MRFEEKKEIISANNFKNFEKNYIYFLIRDEIVVYVGRTKDLYNRIRFHLKNKNFDSFSYIECKKEEQFEKEYYYIFKYMPIYNKNEYRVYVNGYYIISEIRKKYNILELPANKIIEIINKSKYKKTLFTREAPISKETSNKIIKFIINYFEKVK